MPHPTLIRPPPPSPDHSPIEDVLELTHLGAIEPNLFTNTRPLWHPPGARGIYGGAAIAQCLAAAQRTVPDNFSVHSMHAYFVLNGNSEVPIIYHVENVREGRSFCTRTVQARQRGQPIFTTTLSFAREGAGGKKTLAHYAPMSVDVPSPPDDREENTSSLGGGGGNSPIITRHVSTVNADSSCPHAHRTRMWIRARGQISPQGGHQAHLTALAYMSDSNFIGTVARAHRLPRFVVPTTATARASGRTHSRGVKEKATATSVEWVRKMRRNDPEALRALDGMDADAAAELRALDVDAQGNVVRRDALVGQNSDREVGMMVSLDHSIYFHRPRDFRADEWMYIESDSPWAGDGRGLALQRMYTREGVLVASCVQEVSSVVLYEHALSSPCFPFRRFRCD